MKQSWNGIGSWKSGLYFLGGLVAVCLLVASGCGPAEIARRTVTGKVQFQGAAVEEGTVTFEDTSSGAAGTAELGPGGQYKIELPDGNYKVSIAPPMVEVGGSEDTPGDLDYKKVDNIPKKYWNSNSSPLTAEVSASAAEQNFELEP